MQTNINLSSSENLFIELITDGYKPDMIATWTKRLKIDKQYKEEIVRIKDSLTFFCLHAGDSCGQRRYVFRSSTCLSKRLHCWTSVRSICANVRSQERLEEISSNFAQKSTWTQRWSRIWEGVKEQRSLWLHRTHFVHDQRIQTLMMTKCHTNFSCSGHYSTP